MGDKRTLARDRRAFVKGVGAVTAGAALAGCTGGSDDPGDDPDDTPTDESTTAGRDEEATGGDGGDGQEDEEEPFDVRISLGENPTGLDPHRALGATNDIVRQCYETLLDVTEEGEIGPKLATDWERIEPGRVRLYLRDGVTFHNGDEVTAEDAAFSLRRVIHDDVGGIAAAQTLTGVTDAEVVEGEHAIDVLSDGLNTLAFKAVGTAGEVVQKSWIEERDSDQVQLEANGTGPFELEEYEEEVHIQFARFEDYWREPAAVSSVRFTWAGESSTRISQLLNEEVDFITNVPPEDVPRIDDNEGTRAAAGETNRIMFSQLVYAQEPLSSKEFRQAMNYAIDPAAIIENVLSGFGAEVSQPSLPQFFGFDPDLDPYPYDPELAEQLVEESGHAGVEIELHHSVGRYLKDQEVAEATANQLDELPNVSCTAVAREWSSLVGSIADGDLQTNPPMTQLGATHAQLDSAAFHETFFGCGRPLSGYCDEEIDDLIAEANGEEDEQAREELLQEANQILRDDAAWLLQHQIFAIWGLSERIDWEPVPSEEIHVYDMRPA